MTIRLFLTSALAFGLTGASVPEPRIRVTLPAGFVGDPHGRLLIFAEPASPENANTDQVDVHEVDAGSSGGQGVFVAAREVASFGHDRAVTIDTGGSAYPDSLAAMKPGMYRVQAVLDRNGEHNYSGRAPGDIVSKVATVRFPLASTPLIRVDHELAPAIDQFDTAGLPPKAAEQIAASRPHLHEEHIASALLTGFRGRPQVIAAWVLTPPGYDPKVRTTYPTIYTAGGFGATHKLDGQQLSVQWHMMETGAIPPMIWVALDYAMPTGTTEFADSVNNGPWGQALVGEVIPTLERRYRMDAKPSGRFLTGHSSGGWFALWMMVRYPALFGGSWPTSPDPSDFHDFTGVDLYAPGVNMYRDANGSPRPLERDHAQVLVTIEQEAKLESVLGRTGGQLQSFDWTFSPRGLDGMPIPMFDRVSGAVNPAVVAYWRDHYDVAHRIERDWPRLKKDLDGKLHLTVGTADSNYLDGSVHRLEAVFRKVGGQADFIYVADATHSMAQVYARNGDRTALRKDMTKAMYAIARPGKLSTPK